MESQSRFSSRSALVADPKLRARYVATAEEWVVLLKALSLIQGRRCGCGCGRKAQSAHHLVPKSQSGDDVLSNLVLLNGDGTRGCHGALTSANRAWDGKDNYAEPADVRAGIGRNLRPDQLAYISERIGLWYVEQHYAHPDRSLRS